MTTCDSQNPSAWDRIRNAWQSGIFSPVPCRCPPITSSEPGCSRIRFSCCALPGTELHTDAMTTIRPLLLQSRRAECPAVGVAPPWLPAHFEHTGRTEGQRTYSFNRRRLPDACDQTISRHGSDENVVRRPVTVPRKCLLMSSGEEGMELSKGVRMMYSTLYHDTRNFNSAGPLIICMPLDLGFAIFVKIHEYLVRQQTKPSCEHIPMTSHLSVRLGSPHY